MPLQVNWNPRQLEANIAQIGERAIKGMSARMRLATVKIRDLAREYAPVDTGTLERGIDWARVRDGRRDAYVVFVDLDAMRSSGKALGDYAYIMENQLRPYGNKGKAFFLGPRSAAKAAGGARVGGRFLSRAINEGTKDLLGQLAEEVRRVTRSSDGRTLLMQRQPNTPDYSAGEE